MSAKSSVDSAIDRFSELPASDRSKLNRSQRVDWFVTEVRKAYPSANRSRLEATFSAIEKARGEITSPGRRP